MWRFVCPTLIALVASQSTFAKDHPRFPRTKDTPEPAVVRTWGDLFDQPVHTLSDGTKVRVGLDTKQVGAYSALLVYALVDGVKYECRATQPLGPLEIHLMAPRADKASDNGKVALPRIDADAGSKIKHLLFASTVFVGRAGTYELWLLGPDRFVVAAITLDVTDNRTTLPWFSFGLQTDTGMEKARDRRRGERIQAQVGFNDCLHALPNYSGHVPILSRPDRGKEIPLTQPLPHLSCFEPDPGLKLQATQKRLRVDADFEMELSHPSDRFLFRLWVNDRLYEPKLLDKTWGEARHGDFIPGKSVDFDWTFDAKKVGAKKGDRVAVQLLYCCAGWQEVGGRYARTLSDASRTLPRSPRATPKVEFIVR